MGVVAVDLRPLRLGIRRANRRALSLAPQRAPRGGTTACRPRRTARQGIHLTPAAILGHRERPQYRLTCAAGRPAPVTRTTVGGARPARPVAWLRGSSVMDGRSAAIRAGWHCAAHLHGRLAVRHQVRALSRVTTW